MATQTSKRILISPLDWGLGHTSRCIPIIGCIQSLGHVPVVACNESQRSFIEETFSDIEIIHIDGYDITYSKWNRFGQIGVLSQLPRLNKVIIEEHNWLQQHAKLLKLDGIISDNRYGLFHSTIPSVIMTHQLKVQTGVGKFADRTIQKLHYKYLDRFGATWVVDVPGITNLAGELSHPRHLPHRTTYLGLLSQFEGLAGKAYESVGDTLLVLLSGPEPQRTELSNMLWQQVQDHNGKVIFVDGSDIANTPARIPPHIIYHKRLAGKALAATLQGAGMVICRSGYSTILDLVALNKRAILIPTPGQTEQEYLGKCLSEEKVFYCTKQSEFDLKIALREAGRFQFHSLQLQNAYSGYRTVLTDWISSF